MAKKSPKNQALEAIRRASMDEAAAVAFIEGLRWGQEPACPRCGDTDVYAMKGRKTGEREKGYRWRCRGCNRQFSVRTGTVFEETRLPLRVWLHALWRACSSKKGVSALQISRECEITHKSALYLLHRIRLMMTDDSPGKLGGIVEVDETFVGGKPRYRNRRQEDTGRRIVGRGTRKAAVMALVERGGRAYVRHIDAVTAKNLQTAVRELVDPRATVMTDEERGYVRLWKVHPGPHDTVNHSRKEYVRGNVHTNTVEGFFSLLKRGVYGTYHSVSRHHLHRYLSEFEFRYNTRGLNDGERIVEALKGAEGKRLQYRTSA